MELASTVRGVLPHHGLQRARAQNVLSIPRGLAEIQTQRGGELSTIGGALQTTRVQCRTGRQLCPAWALARFGNPTVDDDALDSRQSFHGRSTRLVLLGQSRRSTFCQRWCCQRRRRHQGGPVQNRTTWRSSASTGDLHDSVLRSPPLAQRVHKRLVKIPRSCGMISADSEHLRGSAFRSLSPPRRTRSWRFRRRLVEARRTWRSSADSEDLLGSALRSPPPPKLARTRLRRRRRHTMQIRGAGRRSNAGSGGLHGLAPRMRLLWPEKVDGRVAFRIFCQASFWDISGQCTSQLLMQRSSLPCVVGHNICGILSPLDFSDGHDSSCLCGC
eukprot:TRINITY_DN50155_c0_g1_i1.p1 TRINITY_DN50155_c0_g1~~TRINITY_DN50155_c0_g1_i1.p1  ORF type:complete len:349 (+),score=20.88 TRINITY_DN50155_c0_g1_i1:59-1048(+)